MLVPLALLMILLPGHAVHEATPSAQVTAVVAQNQATLAARNRMFLEAVRARHPGRVAGFFPRHGTFEYVFTEHRQDGDNHESRRFPGSAAQREISNGSLWESFDIQYEHQPIGLLLHQI